MREATAPEVAWSGFSAPELEPVAWRTSPHEKAQSEAGRGLTSAISSPSSGAVSVKPGGPGGDEVVAVVERAPSATGGSEDPAHARDRARRASGSLQISNQTPPVSCRFPALSPRSRGALPLIASVPGEAEAGLV